MGFQDIVFDLYGTLVDIHTEESDSVWEKTALFCGYYGAHYTGAELKTAFQRILVNREAAAGQSYECYPDIPFESVMAQLLRERGITDHADCLGVQAAQLFRVLSTDYIRLYPAVKEALSMLREKGLRLWLLSNAQQIFTAYEVRHLGLGAQFDGILLSSDYGCRKPDPRFYTALFTKHGLQPDTCLMVGNDRQTDIAGAKKVGMATLYMHTALTPADQTSADPDLHPLIAPFGCRHYEYEGNDWQTLAQMILNICDL